MTVPSAPLFKLTRITADAAIKAAPGKIWAIMLEGGSDASSLDFLDALTLTGTAVIGITAPFTDADASTQSTVFVDFTSLGGISFATGIYCDWTGTGAVGYVWTS